MRFVLASNRRFFRAVYSATIAFVLRGGVRRYLGNYPMILVLGACFTTSAIAAEADPLEVKVQAELRVIEHDGKLVNYRYTPAARFEQGQELYYTVRIRNNGTSPLHNAVVVQPIPAHTHYVAHSATGAGALISFSIDNGNTFGAPDELRLPRLPFESNENGNGAATKRATPGDYTHIRWQLQHALEPGAVVLARFRVVFN